MLPCLTVNQSFPLLEDDLLALGDGDVLLLGGGVDGCHGGLALEHQVAFQEVTLVHLSTKSNENNQTCINTIISPNVVVLYLQRQQQLQRVTKQEKKSTIRCSVYNLIVQGAESLISFVERGALTPSLLKVFRLLEGGDTDEDKGMVLLHPALYYYTTLFSYFCLISLYFQIRQA